MSKTSIPVTMRKCATCRCWTGTAIPNAFCSWVEIDAHIPEKSVIQLRLC